MKTILFVFAVAACSLWASDSATQSAGMKAPSAVLTFQGMRPSEFAVMAANDGSKIISKREPIVTKTADGWEITFKPVAPPEPLQYIPVTSEPHVMSVGETPKGAKPGDHWVNVNGEHCRLAADGVNIETDAGNGTVISTALFVQTSNTPKF